MGNKNDRWSALSMSERADLIKLYVSNGITSLDTIKKDYNSFDVGGPTREMTPSEAAALNKTLNNSQYMLAVGDSPDDPEYLSTDYLEPAVVKAFDSNEDYNRYYGEQFGRRIVDNRDKLANKTGHLIWDVLQFHPWIGTALDVADVAFSDNKEEVLPSALAFDGKITEMVESLGKSKKVGMGTVFGKLFQFTDIANDVVNLISDFKKPISEYSDGGKINSFGGGGDTKNTSEVQLPTTNIVTKDNYLQKAEEGHDSQLNEKHSDILGLKYLLYKEGIYDARGNTNVTPEQIEELRKKYPELRPLIQMDNEKAAWMVNHVAQNTTNSKSLDYINPDNIAAFGGKINRFDDGGSKGGEVLEFLNNVVRTPNRAVKGELMDLFQTLQHGIEASKYKIAHNKQLDSGVQNYFTNEYSDPAQTSFLFSRKEQERAMLNSGYIKGTPKDYGLVARAVGDRDLPVYQKQKDDAYVGNLRVLGNIKNKFFGTEGLEHAGSFPTTIYVDEAGNIFQKAWDLQDYGVDSVGNAGTKYNKGVQQLANVLNFIGNPIVRTTGLQKLNKQQQKYLLAELKSEELKNSILDSSSLGNELMFESNIGNIRYGEYADYINSLVKKDKNYHANISFDAADKIREEYQKLHPFEKYMQLHHPEIVANPLYQNAIIGTNIKAGGGKLNKFETGGPKDTKHVEDVVRTTRGSTGRIFTRDFPWVDVLGAKHLFDSWRVMRGNDKKVAPSDDNYTGTAMKGVGVQTDDGLGFASQQDLANALGYTPKDFVDTYVYGVTPFEKLGVFKKEDSPERHVIRSKVKKVEDSGKQVNTYQTQRDTLDTNTVAALDSLLNAGLVDLRQENTTYQKSPFNIGDSGIIYDGNNSTIATAYLPNGMPVSKAIDVFDTDPKEWNYSVGPMAKKGLGFIHDNTNPFIMTTPWYYPIKSTDYLSRLYYLFGIDADREYNVRENKGDKNGVIWELSEALEWLDNHPDLTEMPVKDKKD